eukprot:802638-Rhodomonas_salina.1
MNATRHKTSLMTVSVPGYVGTVYFGTRVRGHTCSRVQQYRTEFTCSCRNPFRAPGSLGPSTTGTAVVHRVAGNTRVRF